MARLIAFYLPQYHPIPENNKWYGNGFTEWTNVAKAKPLFPGHYQPHIPADLGFYDLRLKETRRQQAALAEEYGLSAFCYWNYWFGAGKQLLEMPIWEVYKDREITFPFCLGWANHSWEKKLWDKNGTKELIIKQNYFGRQDYINYFNTMLPLFRDKRYFRVENKLFFLIFMPLASPEIRVFIETWRKLAKKEGVGDFFFVGRAMERKEKKEILETGFDAVYNENAFNIYVNSSIASKGICYLERHILKRPKVFKYRDAMKYMITKEDYQSDTIPSVVPNYDHSPRSGGEALILDDCRPEYFLQVVKEALNAVAEKPIERQIIMVKSWNEWGEGNHLEPDLKYGRGYLEAIRNALKTEERA